MVLTKTTMLYLYIKRSNYLFKVNNLDQEDLDKIASFEEALQKYESQLITVDEFSLVIQKFGKKLTFWDTKIEANPKYPDGIEGSRTGFKWNPTHNIKGKYYQSVIKKIALKLIDILHDHTLKKYDKNQFVYDDIRLIELDDFAKAYIQINFKDGLGYKDIFMHKILDIVHGTIAKEDIYYRSVYFDFINQLIKQYPKGFELTLEEKENLRLWHKNGKR